MIKIFDSLTHPTIDGTWLNPKYNQYCDISYLSSEMKKNHIYKAFAVGLKNVGAYDLQQFIKFVEPYDNLIPIAFCENISELETIKSLGYQGIKIHPRISNIQGDEDHIIEIIQHANQMNLVVLYCGFQEISPMFIEKIKNEKLIFLHCGGQNFKKTYNLLLDKENILLDVSYTLNKYTDILSDIREAFQKNAHRFCIGSDHPEVELKEFRNIFKEVTKTLTTTQKEQIAFRNIETFLQGIQDEHTK